MSQLWSAILVIAGITSLSSVAPVPVQAHFPSSQGGCPLYTYPASFALNATSLPTTIQRALDKCEAAAQHWLERQGTVGMVVGVVSDNGLIWSKVNLPGWVFVCQLTPARVNLQGFGGLTKGGAAPNADSKFRIGSITKVLTTTTMLALRDEGKVCAGCADAE